MLLICIYDLKATAIPSSRRRKNEIGIKVFNIYLAGRPPASGEVSLILKEIETKFSDDKITIIQNGINKNNEPSKLSQAFFFGENRV